VATKRLKQKVATRAPIPTRRGVSLHLIALVTAILLAGFAAADPALKVGSYVDLSGMRDVAGREFRTSMLPGRAFLVFNSNRKSADQSRRWGDAVSARYGDNLAKWDEERGQPVLVVPVADLSNKPWMVPQGVVSKMVKMLGGGDDVLMDWNGTISKKVAAPSGQPAVILIGPDSRVQAIATGDYSPSAATALFAAIDADVKARPHAPSDSAGPGRSR